jgi:hypothetical protein
MIYARLTFQMHGCQHTALLTDRGWTIIHAAAGAAALLNHICPLHVEKKDGEGQSEFSDRLAHAAADCANRAAEILKGTVNHA